MGLTYKKHRTTNNGRKEKHGEQADIRKEEE